MRRSLVVLACSSLALTLAACGGGDGMSNVPGQNKVLASGTNGSATPTTPETPEAPAESLPAAGTWTVVSTTDNAQTGDYLERYETPVSTQDLPLSASDPSATLPMLFVVPTVWQGTSHEETSTQMVGGVPVTLTKTVYEPTNALVSVMLWVNPADPTKYLIVVSPESKTYACAGPGFGDVELAGLATNVMAIKSSEVVPRCVGTLDIDVQARTYQSIGLTLMEKGDSSMPDEGGNTAEFYPGSPPLQIKVNGQWPDLANGG